MPDKLVLDFRYSRPTLKVKWIQMGGTPSILFDNRNSSGICTLTWWEVLTFRIGIIDGTAHNGRILPSCVTPVGGLA